MTVGAFQDNAFDAFAFAIEYEASFAITEATDTASFEVNFSTAVSFTITENADQAAFELHTTTVAGFNILEPTDIAVFEVEVEENIFVEFAITEPADLASFEVGAATRLEFSITEPSDIAAFSMTGTTRVSFTITEPTDIAYFRAFSAFFGIGEADYIFVPVETQTMILPSPLDRLIIPNDQFARTANVPSELQEINVAQTRAMRKEVQ